MSVFAIGDLHLSLGDPKPMDIFPGWQNHVERLERGWLENVGAEDTVVIAGDFSWAMSLRDATPDFLFLESLPGRKLLIKGNHDYWWTSMSKMTDFFARLGLTTVSILHNNSASVEGLALCGSRGWLFENGEAFDKKLIAREYGRIERSLASADTADEPVLFLHYPPIFRDQRIDEFLELIHRYNVRRCYYGHLHGSASAYAVDGVRDGVRYNLISADYLSFLPLRVK